MTKHIEWRNPNHMKFDSLHKTFNRQADLISTGNVIGGVQLSGYVRPKCETECNGQENAPGHLQEWDLTEGFGKSLPDYVKRWIRENDKGKSVIAYQFFHYNGHTKVNHGFVVTTDHKDGYKLLKVWYANNKAKSRSVIDEAIKYITG